jgi:hypothetical protein
MSRVLSVDDEYLHAPTSDSDFNESMYFNFVDHRHAHAGLIRMGNRINEGHAEVTVLIYLPGAAAAFRFDRPPISASETFEAGGLRFEIVEPGKHVRVTYRGSVHRLADGTDLADPGTALRNSPQLPLTVHLDYRGLAPLFGLGHGESGTAGMGGGEEMVASQHYEIPCRVVGSIQLGDERIDIDGLGIRDHSWGPRRWQAPTYWRWLSGMIDERNGFVAWSLRVDDRGEPGSGMWMRDGVVSRLIAIDVDSDYGPPPHYPTGMRLVMTAQSGERVTVSGEVLAAVPLRNRKAGAVARLAELVCRYTVETDTGGSGIAGRTAYGIAEYHDLILEGVPAGMGQA